MPIYFIKKMARYLYGVNLNLSENQIIEIRRTQRNLSWYLGYLSEYQYRQCPCHGNLAARMDLANSLTGLIDNSHQSRPLEQHYNQ